MAEKLYSLGEETEQIEFKKSTGELKESVISIASILNKHGSGKLYFGVKNDGTVIGRPGKFPDGVTPEMFIREIRKPIRRNPLITRTLYYSKDMESFATGLKRIQDACDELGCKVEYYGDNYGFTVRFYRHCGEGWQKNTKSKAPKHQDEALEQRLIALIKGNPQITQRALSDELSVSRATVQRLCKELSDKGLMERKGGKRFGYWEIHEDVKANLSN